MKRVLITSFILSVVLPLSANAEETVVGSYIADIEEAATARVSARDLLQNQPKHLKINVPKVETIKTQPNKNEVFKNPEKPQKENLEETLPNSEPVTELNQSEQEEVIDAPSVAETKLTPQEPEPSPEESDNRYIQAPFDLYWGASEEYMQKQGWELTPATREGYENVFNASHNEHPHNSFETVSAIFGHNDKLWCIYAESMPIDDTPQASKILELYEKYYNALEQKYGHAEIHFEPYTYELQTTQMQNGKPVLITQTVQNPVGGDTFLQELQEGKARLYSTFYNNDIGATLAIYVDENAQSRLIIEYKNLPLMQQERQQTPNQAQTMEGL